MEQNVITYRDIPRKENGSIQYLDTNKKITISEKLDGANAAFYIKDDGDIIYMQSRKKPVNEENDLRGFYNWVKKHIEPRKFLLYPNHIYYGEWLVPHTVKYKEEYYNRFYLFDIYDINNNKFLDKETILFESKKLNIDSVPILYIGYFKDINHILSFVGKSEYTEEPNTGEGVVVTIEDYTNEYNEQVCMKFLSDKFLEVKPKKKPKANGEIREDILLVKSVITKPRVEKIMLKQVDEGVLSFNDFNLNNMKSLIQIIPKLVYEDILKEEYELLKNIPEKVIEKNTDKITPYFIREVILERNK